MRIHLATTVIFLSQFVCVVSFTLLDRYYERLTRDDPSAPFDPLGHTELIEDDSPYPEESPGNSIGFMVAPVHITNPFYNFISKAGQLYRLRPIFGEYCDDLLANAYERAILLSLYRLA
ncbi:hypothetical protein Q1695_016127 [Nippostrongylus brasiliensis]|nr:hypothetical protein Q1695_016127 [Nippostrongylus brasiliensis]